MKLLVGTSKGLVTFTYLNKKFEISNLEFEGFEISCIHSHFDGGLYCSISHKHWGVKLYHKKSQSSDWTPIGLPKFQKDHLDVKGRPAILKQIWHIHHGGKNYPDRIWLGTEPGALFLSEDKGQNWKLIDSLWNHETRVKSKQWFGAGKDLPFVHSIIVHPDYNDIIYISVSCAGVFKSEDSGLTWKIMNKGMKASYLPNPTPIAGYDPHSMLMSRKNKNVLWQQNHCGIYKSENRGNTWADKSGRDGFPGYGFSIAIEEDDTNTAWVIPVEDETKRVPLDHKLCVMKTEDGGHSWNACNVGLPAGLFFGIVLRNGFVKNGKVLAFGTTNGNLYFSDNYGDSWQECNTNLAKVNYISFINDN